MRPGLPLPYGAKKMSFEASLRGRVDSLSRADSPFLPEEKRGGFFEEVRASLDQASDQREYNRILEFENLDLQVREKKQICLILFQRILADHPHLELERNSYVEPQEAFVSYLSDIQEELAKNSGSLLNDSGELQI